MRTVPPTSLFYIDHLVPEHIRRIISVFISSAFLVVSLLVSFSYVYGVSDGIFRKGVGVLSLVLFFGLLVFLVNRFYTSHYYSYPAAYFEYLRILDIARRKNIPLVRAFILSPSGSHILSRLGIDVGERAALAKQYEGRVRDNSYDEESVQTLSELTLLLFDKDETFARLLAEHSVSRSDVSGAATWVEKEKEHARVVSQWWSKDNLSQTHGIGRAFAYGMTYALDRYAQDVTETPGIFSFGSAYFVREKEVARMEAALGKVQEANILLVGPPGVGKKEVVRYFAYRALLGKTVRHLRYKRVLLLSSLFIVSSSRDKNEFELRLIKLLIEAQRAGNVILVFDDFPEFLKSAEELGSDAASILSKFLSLPDLPIIALSDDYRFHRIVEPNQELMGYFEKVTVAEPDKNEMLFILEEEVHAIERGSQMMFTYQALILIATGVDRYFTEGVFPNKAIDMLEEVASWAAQKNIALLEGKNIEDFLEEKTQIPMGKIDEEEKKKLLSLEQVLHKRIVGQDEAVSLVSDALRRARADIRAGKRPMGTFLFLGPTGVGKTETAKALAQVFFGGEEHLLRLDMSEYQEQDAISKLIGSFESGTPGVFSRMLRSHPYGVFLLDEFEKAHPDVHDLFLQVLDEGFFSDMHGRRVNARNIIFIATSNAGSDLIYEKVKSNTSLSASKKEIVDALIGRGVFKPELINRFDAVVLYHPLDTHHIEQVAVLLLKELAERLIEKNIHLVINEPLIKSAIQYGYDKRFGARAMRRAIANKIENVIAEKIIKGEIEPGKDLILSSADLE